MVAGQRRRWVAQFKDDRGNKPPTNSCISIPPQQQPPAQPSLRHSELYLQQVLLPGLIYFVFIALLRVGSMLVPAWDRHWQGRGRVRFVGAASSGTASPHTPQCAASWPTDKLITHLEGSQNSGAAEIRTGKSIRHLMPSSLAQKNRPQAVLSLSVLKIPPQSRLQSVPATDSVFCCTKAFLNG